MGRGLQAERRSTQTCIMQHRNERAKRIVHLLRTRAVTVNLPESSYRKLPAITKRFSTATASRDLVLCRRIHFQFLQMFGRPLKPRKDLVVWSWDWSHYGFRTAESKSAGYIKPVGKFPLLRDRLLTVRTRLAGSAPYPGTTKLTNHPASSCIR